MTRLAATAIAVACALSCSRHDASERDTKGRGEAIIGGTITTVEAAREASAGPDSLVEGVYVTLTWPGKITESTGTAPAVGTACTLSVHGGMLRKQSPAHDRMTVTCGNKKIFDEADAINGVTSALFVLSEHPIFGEVSAFRYELLAHDKGERTGRNQIDARTTLNEVTVYSETIPTFRVEIKLDPKRDIRRDKPLYFDDIPPFSTVSKWTASLTSSKGGVPFTGKTCNLAISPGDAKHNCLVQLECAKKIQYGADADDYSICNVDMGNVVGVDDRKPTPVDGDPALRADLAALKMTFADEPANGAPWSASFTLAPAL